MAVRLKYLERTGLMKDASDVHDVTPLCAENVLLDRRVDAVGSNKSNTY